MIQIAHGLNVLGTELETCCRSPMTGFYRDGTCRTGRDDLGAHVVCARLTADFLAFSKEHGNDLSTPQPAIGFEGLKPGQRWCMCAARWLEAYEAGRAPQVVLEATDQAALDYIPLTALRELAIGP